MVKRRLIRVLVPHSKTMYFVEMGQPRGIAYEALKAFEDEINKKRGNLKVNVVFFPTTRDQMMPDSARGAGRHRRRGRDGHCRTRKVRGLHDSDHDKADQRDCGDRTAVTSTGVDRRSRRQRRLRAQVVQLLGASRAAQRPVQEGRKSRYRLAPCPRGPRRRGPSRDAECGPLRHCRRRRLQAGGLVEDLSRRSRPGRTWP